jgi:hypothetical protein
VWCSFFDGLSIRCLTLSLSFSHFLLLFLFLSKKVIVTQENKLMYVQELFVRMPIHTRRILTDLLGLLKSLSLSTSQPVKAAELAQLFGQLLLRPKERLYYMQNDDAKYPEILTLLIEEKI